MSCEGTNRLLMAGAEASNSCAKIGAMLLPNGAVIPLT
jgi:hypothetical protein